MFFLFRSYDKFCWLLYKENHFSLYYPDHKFGFLLIALQGKLFLGVLSRFVVNYRD